MTFQSRLSLVVVVALAAAPVQAQTIIWLTDYNMARREAHDKNLPLIIDFSTENCHWCRQLEATTFRDPAVVKLLSERFVALRLDGEKDADLAKSLGVTGFPTLIFADVNGKILGKQDGYVKATEFTQILQRTLASLPPRVDPGVRQAVHVSDSTTQPLDAEGERTRTAGRLLVLAKTDYQEQRFLGCLERCKALKAEYADLAAGAEALKLEAKIRRDPTELAAACDSLADRLGEMYMDMAEALILKGEPQKAVPCLEWVLQARPGTPQAEAAKARLGQIKDR
jgi:thioredoxin-related protein